MEAHMKKLPPAKNYTTQRVVDTPIPRGEIDDYKNPMYKGAEPGENARIIRGFQQGVEGVDLHHSGGSS